MDVTAELLALAARRLDDIALFDEADRESLMRHRWQIDKAGYIYTNIARKRILMHRFIMAPPDGAQIDHINGRKNDNRRCNLRLATQQQNGFNRGPNTGRKYKGVYRRWIYRKTSEGYPVAYRYYFAMIVISGKQRELKWSSDPEVCARAYDAAARLYHGEFAKLNFPDSIAASLNPLDITHQQQ